MAKILVRRDEKGIYIRHGDEIARPVINSEYGHYGEETNGYRDFLETQINARICWDGKSSFLPGLTIKKHHISQTTKIVVSCVLDGKLVKEMWFLEID